MRKALAAVLMCALGVAVAAPLEIKLNLRMGNQAFAWDQTYQNPLGQPYQIDTLKVYISDVALVRADGSEVRVGGLALVDFKKNASTQDVSVMLADVPAGEYRGLRFAVGVPREANHRDAATQALPLGVDSGMYWAWNPGYIFYRLEGRAQLPAGEQKWVLHLGTDAYKVPVNLSDLQTNRIRIAVPESGAVLRLNLDLAKSFLSGAAGAPYDWSKAEYRQMHSVSPQTSPIALAVYFNLVSAFSLAQ